MNRSPSMARATSCAPSARRGSRPPRRASRRSPWARTDAPPASSRSTAADVARGGTDLQQELERIARDIDRAFDLLLEVPDDPRASLYEAMRHATIGGG